VLNLFQTTLDVTKQPYEYIWDSRLSVWDVPPPECRPGPALLVSPAKIASAFVSETMVLRCGNPVLNLSQTAFGSSQTAAEIHLGLPNALLGSTAATKKAPCRHGKMLLTL